MNENNNANVALTNIKVALDMGELRKLQNLKETKEEKRKNSG